MIAMGCFSLFTRPLMVDVEQIVPSGTASAAVASGHELLVNVLYLL